MTYNQAVKILSDNGQEHILSFWNSLDESAKESLLAQIESLDFNAIASMKQMLGKNDSSSSSGVMNPPDVAELSGEALDSARRSGINALCDGKVGVIVVAGGQGSRLGYDGPKGCFPVGPVTNESLFHFHARKILALERRYKTSIPFYVMTSLLNESATRSFFEKNKFFGLDKSRVFFFSQAMWPALDSNGKIILDAPDHIFLSPDGHGGMLAALDRSGCLADMEKRGIKSVFYFQVDNPMVDIADPAFIGHHLLSGADISLKLCAKRDANEGLGMVIERDGKLLMVEYSELTDKQKNEKRADGRLKLLYGSVAIHVFSTSFLRKEADAGLPIHIAHKKVPVCGPDGITVKPTSSNAFKFEKFIFDVMPDAKICSCVAFDRSEEFSPVKNAEGADSPATCRRDLSTKWGRWLADCGFDIEFDNDGYAVHKIEIDPCYAVDISMLKEKINNGKPELNTNSDILLV